jgi:two-component system, OmpR family, phosphate regulon sensor histidine kinase PhoR
VTDQTESAAFEALLGRRSDHLFVIVDESLRIVRAGSEAAALAERSEAELVGMSLIATFGSASLDAVARQALTADGASGEAALGHLGARRFAIDAVPLRGGGLVLSLHDITQLKRIERVRRDFVANIGHELRTPLTSIKLLAESLSSGAVDDLETMREFAGQVERETDHLAQLVDELLDLTMIESGETTLTTSPIDPDAVVRDCATRIGPVAERRQIRVRQLPGPSDRLQALADPERLGQALLNLAHNAVKYSHTGGEIRLGWEPGGSGRVRFTVADDGIGVPEIHQPRIFERFYKVDRARTRDPGSPLGGSAGLGLSIVRHIAEAHGGTVGVTSEEGAGSTFWIEVPAAVA